jgi:hypothetical protein
MKPLNLATGVVLLLTSVLEFAFMALSCMGSGMGGLMSFAALTGGMKGEDAVVGVIVLLFYGVWLLATLFAAPTHLMVGVYALRGGDKAWPYWLGAAAAFAAMLTVYCMMPATVSAVLCLILGVQAGMPKPEESL